MSLGTKNRLQQNATICRDHLRATFADKPELVSEFIAETEGASEDAAAAWAQFSDLSRSRTAMLARVEEAFREWLG